MRLEKILEEIIEQLKAEGCIKDDDAGNRAVEIIRKHMNDGWIPVDERLPEKDGWYLCTLDGVACGEEEPFVTMCEFTDETWDEEYDDGVIIAWQPLPEAYRSETLMSEA